MTTQQHLAHKALKPSPAALARSFTFLLVILLTAAWAAQATTYYVATNGNDAWNGRAPAHGSGNNGPFASLAKARSVAVAGDSVEVRQGTYYLALSPTTPGTLSFTSTNSGTLASPIIWEKYSLDAGSAIVSGGVPVGTGGLNLTWTHNTGVNANLWQVQLPTSLNLQPFEYLFYRVNGSSDAQRRLRARVEDSSGVGYYMNNGVCTSTQGGDPPPPSACNLATYLRVTNTVDPGSALGSGCPSVTDDNDNTSSKCLDRFFYTTNNPNAIKNWANLTSTTVTSQPCAASTSYPVGDVELTLFDAWTVDVMRINCVDTTNQVIYLISPTKGNSGNYNFFGPTVGHRYIVENAKDSFNAAMSAGQTGLWFVDRSTSHPSYWLLSYLANSGENPNTDMVVIPQLGGQFPQSSGQKDYIGASLISATNLSYVTFRNLIFEIDNFVPSYTNGVWGFNNDVNGELSVPQAIDCEGCQNVTFDNVRIRHTSASGAAFSSSTTATASGDTIQNSVLYDVGDSGVRIGHTPDSNDSPTSVVNAVTVNNNLIDGYSRVFPDGEGIAEGNGHDNTFLHNDITDGYHAGISVCQLGCGPIAANGTNIHSDYNHLSNIMQGVTSDGGTLYYNVGNENGSGSGNQVYNNLVHDVTDSSIIDGYKVYKGTGYGGEGIYLDAQTGDVDVKNNVVFKVAAFTAWMTEGPTVKNSPNPNTFSNNIFSLGILGMFGQQEPWPQFKDGSHSCDLQNPSPNLGTQVEFHSNIFNFDRTETSLPPPTMPFDAVWGCETSCGLNFNQFQDFEDSEYWRTTGGFATDSMAFFVIANPQPRYGGCSQSSPIQWLNFSLWQTGTPPNTPVIMDEDTGGLVQNPQFGTTGTPQDYLFTGITTNRIPPGFDPNATNDTINNAGRTSGPAIVNVPPTFPIYSYTSY